MQIETAGFGTTVVSRTLRLRAGASPLTALGMRELDLYKGLKVLAGEMPTPFWTWGSCPSLLRGWPSLFSEASSSFLSLELGADSWE